MFKRALNLEMTKDLLAARLGIDIGKYGSLDAAAPDERQANVEDKK